MKRVCVLGAGAWGTAVSDLLGSNGYKVNLWCYNPSAVESIVKKHRNEVCFPDAILSDNIHPETDIEACLSDVEWVFEAIPVKFLRSVLQRAKPYFSNKQAWVVLSKGIEQGSLLFPYQMIDDVFCSQVGKAVLSGPSFAKDLMLKQATAVDIASDNNEIAEELKGIVDNNFFKAHLSNDLIGVSVGGALKNVIAVAMGILDGAGYSDNTKAFMITAGLHEMVEFANYLGAKKETLYGLAGIGDLVLTCTGGASRNLMVGRHLGLGENLNEILEKTGAIPEGINTIKSVYQIIQKSNIDLPIFTSIYGVVFGNQTVESFINNLQTLR